MLINLLCGVQKLRLVVLQRFPNSTPHNYRRHITHCAFRLASPRGCRHRAKMNAAQT